MRLRKEARRALTIVGEGDSNDVYEDGSDRLEKDCCATLSSGWLGRVRLLVITSSIEAESGATRHRQPFYEQLRLGHMKAKNDKQHSGGDCEATPTLDW